MYSSMTTQPNEVDEKQFTNAMPTEHAAGEQHPKRKTTLPRNGRHRQDHAVECDHLAAEIRHKHEKCQQSMRRSAETAIEVGGLLARARNR